MAFSVAGAGPSLAASARHGQRRRALEIGRIVALTAPSPCGAPSAGSAGLRSRGDTNRRWLPMARRRSMAADVRGVLPAAAAAQGGRSLAARAGGAPEAPGSRLRPDVVGQERAHLAARHALALLSDRLRRPRRAAARVRQPQARGIRRSRAFLYSPQLPAQLHRQLDRQVRILRQEDRDAGPRSARHRRLPIFSVEVSDAGGQEDAERLSGAWRRGAHLRFHHQPGGRPARDHRLPRDVAARAAAGAGRSWSATRTCGPTPRGAAAVLAFLGTPGDDRRSGTRSPMPPTTT